MQHRLLTKVDSFTPHLFNHTIQRTRQISSAYSPRQTKEQTEKIKRQLNLYLSSKESPLKPN